MAFKYVGYGPPLVAWCDGVNICVEEPTGKVAKYPCDIGVQIPKQIVDFYAKEVMCILKKDDVTFYLRRQGSFSGIRDDGVLVRFGHWEAPPKHELKFIGTYRAKIPRQALLDITDNRTVYIAGEPRAYVFHKPMDIYFFLPSAVGDMVADMSGLRIHTLEGTVDEGAAGKWFVPSMPWSRDRRVYL